MTEPSRAGIKKLVSRVSSALRSHHLLLLCRIRVPCVVGSGSAGAVEAGVWALLSK